MAVARTLQQLEYEAELGRYCIEMAAHQQARPPCQGR